MMIIVYILEDRELLFHLDEVHPYQQPAPSEGSSDKQSLAKLRVARPPPYFFSSLANPKFGINMTPAPFIPGARIDHHLGSLNFFFIRESTNVREVGVSHDDSSSYNKTCSRLVVSQPLSRGS